MSNFGIEKTKQKGFSTVLKWLVRSLEGILSRMWQELDLQVILGLPPDFAQAQDRGNGAGYDDPTKQHTCTFFKVHLPKIHEGPIF